MLHAVGQTDTPRDGDGRSYAQSRTNSTRKYNASTDSIPLFHIIDNLTSGFFLFSDFFFKLFSFLFSFYFILLCLFLTLSFHLFLSFILSPQLRVEFQSMDRGHQGVTTMKEMEDAVENALVRVRAVLHLQIIFSYFFCLGVTCFL